MIEVGDVVRIVSSGGEFSRYSTFFTIHNIEHLEPDWDCGGSRRDMICDVVFVGEHERPSDYPFGVAVLREQQSKHIYLFNPRDLWVIRKAAPCVTEDDLLYILAV